MVSQGSCSDIKDDVSKTHVHVCSNYYSKDGWCGAPVTIDQATVCGIHYHTDGENTSNQFMPFDEEVHGFLVGTLKSE